MRTHGPHFQCSHQEIEHHPDSQLWENQMVTKAVPADVDIQLRIFIGGVTFDDMGIAIGCEGKRARSRRIGRHRT